VLTYDFFTLLAHQQETKHVCTPFQTDEDSGNSEHCCCCGFFIYVWDGPFGLFDTHGFFLCHVCLARWMTDPKFKYEWLDDNEKTITREEIARWAEYCNDKIAHLDDRARRFP